MKKIRGIIVSHGSLWSGVLGFQLRFWFLAIIFSVKGVGFLKGVQGFLGVLVFASHGGFGVFGIL